MVYCLGEEDAVGLVCKGTVGKGEGVEGGAEDGEFEYVAWGLG